LVSVHFGYYHAAVFLVDERREHAVLKAANSPGGKRMLAQAHRLPIGRASVVGSVAESGIYRIASDSGNGAPSLESTDLPETRSEAALPLKVGGEVLGVLDVHSLESTAFLPEEMAALQVVADQLAVAVQNSRLFEANNAALEAARQGYGELTREAWLRLLRQEQGFSYVATADGAVHRDFSETGPRIELSSPEAEIDVARAETTIAVPISVRGQPIGNLRLRKRPGAGTWTPEERSLAEALTDQLSAALEGARLYKDAQQLAAREALVSQISARISAAPRVDGILQETVGALGRALGGAVVSFKFASIAHQHTTGAGAQVAQGSPNEPSSVGNGNSAQEASR
jgi:GAF domain-containing protein